jgi:hypothetical protein
LLAQRSDGQHQAIRGIAIQVANDTPMELVGFVPEGLSADDFASRTLGLVSRLRVDVNRTRKDRQTGQDRYAKGCNENSGFGRYHFSVSLLNNSSLLDLAILPQCTTPSLFTFICYVD